MSQLLDVNLYEYSVLEIISTLSGVADLETIAQAWQEKAPLNIEYWKTSFAQEPIWKYELRKSFQILISYNLVSGSEFGKWCITKEGAELIKNYIPRRESTTLLRVIRNTKISNQLKHLYDYCCQICLLKIPISRNQFYTETHHLKPLGKPDNGPDKKENLIVLCPNHHVSFDYCVMAINPNTMLVEHYSEEREKIEVIGKLNLLKHEIGINYISYHYNSFTRKSNS